LKKEAVLVSGMANSMEERDSSELNSSSRKYVMNATTCETYFLSSGRTQ
jgi:hypothetical protein